MRFANCSPVSWTIVLSILGAMPLIASAGRTVEYDQEVDFSSYRVWRWLEGKPEPPYAAQQMVEEAVERELTVRDLRMAADGADLFVVALALGEMEAQMLRSDWGWIDRIRNRSPRGGTTWADQALAGTGIRYWRVRARNGSCESGWSSARALTLADCSLVFVDGFEAGNALRWSSWTP